MPTKFLVVETPNFQLGANAGATTERIEFAAFPQRIARHFQESAAGSTDLLFILAPSELRLQNAFADAVSGAGPVSLAYFASTSDAIRFLPSLLTFDGAERSGGAKEFLAKGSSIFSETLFNGKAVGTKLDPCFTLARGSLPAAPAASAWACLQALVFLGLQQLPELGEKGTGEKVDVQIGTDERVLAVNVRFNVPPEQLLFLRANPILSLPRVSAGAFELRYVAAARKAELTCLFFRTPGPDRTVEITSYQGAAALENGADVKDYAFRGFGAIPAEPAGAKKSGKGGFKKKFSEQVNVTGKNPEADGSATTVTGSPAANNAPTVVRGGTPTENTVSTVVSGADAPYKEHSVVVSGKATLVVDRETVFKNENAANRVIELEAQVKSLEAVIKTRDELLAKATKDQDDPLAKRDVLTNIKDTQSEGLKQTVKNLETELEEAREREKELMKMVDKAVQMKDDAAKKIKELDLKVKQASTGGGSKVQMLERALEEQKRQNKELSKRVSELNEKMRAA